MTEGTRSYLIGCHQFLLHPTFVLIAWIKKYKRIPNIWQIVCIFVHDIGICGRNYLSGEKKGHWRLGAKIALNLFGGKGFLFCAGHTHESENFPLSKLFWADKGSWLIAPMWWLWWNHYVENFNAEQITHPRVWKEVMAENLLSADLRSSHDLFLIHRNRKG